MISRVVSGVLLLEGQTCEGAPAEIDRLGPLYQVTYYPVQSNVYLDMGRGAVLGRSRGSTSNGAGSSIERKPRPGVFWSWINAPVPIGRACIKRRFSACLLPRSAGRGPARDAKSMIRTRRLKLQPWHDAHRSAFAEMHADPEVMADLGGPIDRAKSDAKADHYISACVENGISRWAVDNVDGAFLGYAGVMRLHHRVQWGRPVEKLGLGSPPGVSRPALRL
jgi:hypothetical protein